MTDRARENSRNKKVEAPVQRKVADNTAASATQGAEPVGVLLQRAQIAPGTLSAGDGRRLQGALGNQNPVVQPKLVVGAVNDPFEQEADRVADQVMSNTNVQVDGAEGSAPAISRMTASSAQRVDMGGDPGGAFEAGEGIQEQLNASRGSGSPLPDELRRKFEPAFGADFGGVRVHTGGNSANMSNAIQAKAFTNGSDIHFNQGVYDPNSSAGQRLLAHELTHVVQQGAVTQTPIAQRKAGSGFAVQRTPFGTIQRTNEKVSSLIAFWEKQKELNAPKKPQGKDTPPAPPPPPPQQQVEDEVFAPTPGAGGGSVFDAPSGGGGGGGGGGSVFDAPSGGVGGGGIKTGTGASAFGGTSPVATGGGGGGGGGVLVTPQGSTGVGASDSTQAGQRPVLAPLHIPKGKQFAPTAKYYADKKGVASEYEGEDTDSTIFVMTKVFGVASESDFFARFDETRRKAALKSIGWTDSDIAELESTHKTKVQYVNDDAERAEYILNLGPTITQGSATVPYDTKDLFANGVGPGHAIFVMDPDGVFYAGRHKVALFHHSSFLGGGDAASAGTVKVTGGKLTEITAKSGHYAPGERQMYIALAELKSRGVSLSGVTLRTMNPNTFKLNPEQDAEAFAAPKAPVVQGPKSSSPISAKESTSISSLGGGAPTAQSNWKTSEAEKLYDAGGSDWEDQLKAKGLRKTDTKTWMFKSFVISLGDLLKILEGRNQPDDFVS